MKLFYLPGACSLAPHIMFHEIGMQVELEKMNKADRTSIAKHNPKALVPTLVLENGKVLTETAVILQYLADLKPELDLIPKAGTWERYKCQEWLNYVATEIHKGIGTLFNKDLDANAKGVFIKAAEKKLAWLNEHFGRNEFFMGKNFTPPDVYAFVTIGWAPHVGIDLSKFPNILGFLERVKSRPSVVAATKAET